MKGAASTKSLLHPKSIKPTNWVDKKRWGVDSTYSPLSTKTLRSYKASQADSQAHSPAHKMVSTATKMEALTTLQLPCTTCSQSPSHLSGPSPHCRPCTHKHHPLRLGRVHCRAPRDCGLAKNRCGGPDPSAERCKEQPKRVPALTLL